MFNSEEKRKREKKKYIERNRKSNGENMRSLTP
jgi:hypothetical protein